MDSRLYDFIDELIDHLYNLTDAYDAKDDEKVAEVVADIVDFCKEHNICN